MLSALPAAGYEGPIPEFPLPIMQRTKWIVTEFGKTQELDENATDRIRDREIRIWEQSWRTPQACAWSMASWRWTIIAEYCRLKAVTEAEPDANASLIAQLHRFRDQIGLTPAGLRDNGWAIAVDQVAQQAALREQRTTEVNPPARKPARDRMKVVGGSG